MICLERRLLVVSADIVRFSLVSVLFFACSVRMFRGAGLLRMSAAFVPAVLVPLGNYKRETLSLGKFWIVEYMPLPLSNLAR